MFTGIRNLLRMYVSKKIFFLQNEKKEKYPFFLNAISLMWAGMGQMSSKSLRSR